MGSIYIDMTLTLTVSCGGSQLIEKDATGCIKLRTYIARSAMMSFIYINKTIIIAIDKTWWNNKILNA